MNLHEAEQLAIHEIKKHNLIDWKIKFTRAVRPLGCCHYRTKTISLSKPLTELNDEYKVLDVILHEIAHALVGSFHGHNEIWRRKALELGCDGNRCYSSDEVVKPKSKYTATCPKCKHVFHRNRKPKYTTSCGFCVKSFTPKLALHFVNA